jgi:hypothetical protein
MPDTARPPPLLEGELLVGDRIPIRRVQSRDVIVLEPCEGRIASAPGSSRTRNQTLPRQQSAADGRAESLAKMTETGRIVPKVSPTVSRGYFLGLAPRK